MKISTKARYGFKFMIHLALNYTIKLVQIREVSVSEKISSKYLEQIAMSFKIAGLVKVTRGAKGGYTLSRPPHEITLLEIINAAEGNLVLTDCIESSDFCQKKDECIMNKLWLDLNNHITTYLEKKTLADILRAPLKTHL